MIDAAATDVWKMAAGSGQVNALVRSLPYLPAGDRAAKVYGELFDSVAALAREPAPRPAAAVRSLVLVPAGALPAGRVQPLAQAIVARVRETPAERRTDPAMLDLVELGARLADALPADVGGPIRRELESLGVRVVRISAVAEEMRFDRQWFVVEAGRPVEIVFTNPDAMPHNIVVGQPGSVAQIGGQGSSMPMPADVNAANVKAFVPNLPSVLFATPLVTSGNQARLSFSAPKRAGRVHLRLHVPDPLDADVRRDAGGARPRGLAREPTPPTDPMTRQPYEKVGRVTFTFYVKVTRPLFLREHGKRFDLDQPLRVHERLDADRGSGGLGRIGRGAEHVPIGRVPPGRVELALERRVRHQIRPDIDDVLHRQPLGGELGLDRLQDAGGLRFRVAEPLAAAGRRVGLEDRRRRAADPDRRAPRGDHDARRDGARRAAVERDRARRRGRFD